jgi:hypothetical protein
MRTLPTRRWFRIFIFSPECGLWLSWDTGRWVGIDWVGIGWIGIDWLGWIGGSEAVGSIGVGLLGWSVRYLAISRISEAGVSR